MLLTIHPIRSRNLSSFVRLESQIEIKLFLLIYSMETKEQGSRYHDLRTKQSRVIGVNAPQATPPWGDFNQ